MLSIEWSFATDESSIRQYKEYDNLSITGWEPSDRLNYVVSTILSNFASEGDDYIIVPDAICTCEIQATPVVLRPYQVRLANSYAHGRGAGALINLPGLRIEFQNRELFFFRGSPDVETAILTQFVQ